jgi:hypothetical protein
LARYIPCRGRQLAGRRVGSGALPNQIGSCTERHDPNSRNHF